MKQLRASLSAALSLSLILLSPGGNAWAQLARAAAPAAAPRATVNALPSASFGLRPGASLNSLTVPHAGLTPALGAPALQAPSLAPAAASIAAPQAAAPASPLAAPAAVAAPSARAAVLAPSAAAESAKPLASALEAAGAQAASVAAPETGAASAKAQSGVAFDLSTLRAAHDGARSDAAVSAAGQGAAKFTASLKKGEKGTPDRYDEQGNPDDGRSGDIDELGNERRRGGEGGPDDATDPDQGGRGGGTPLFGGALLVAGAGLAFGGFSFGSLIVFPFIAISLIMHEIGHAKAAAWLGDYTATLQNRASFNPKHWWTHVDPMMTLVIPAITMLTAGFMFGGAKPVPVNAYNFRNPVKDMAKVAFAGPAVNFILAAAGSLAVTGALAAGLGAAVAGALVTFTFLNVALGVFNLIPLHPLDGSHILRAVLPRDAAAALDRVYDKLGAMSWMPVILVAILGGGMIVGVASVITQLLISIPLTLSGVQAVAAWGLSAGMLGMALAPRPAATNDAPATPIPADGAAAVDLIVTFGPGSLQGVTRDNHLSWVDLNQPNGVDMYAQAQQAMTSQIESAGALGPGGLAQLGATPIATYRRINAATVRLDAVRAGEFERAMRERGHSVHPNSRREIVRPVSPEPEKMDPSARGAVTIEENLKITGADRVHALAKAQWGEPGSGGLRAWLRRLTGAAPPQPKTAVIDSGVALSHPLLRNVREAKNATSGENVDDIGHGTWVHSMVLAYAPWAKNTTHYKTFVNGGATLDDILKALTMAANDGNITMSNSWGSDDGDPNSPDSQLVRKLAEEGHIMVFAAGNAGSRANTIGSPAIVYHRDAATGAIRVVSVAATGRDKKVAYFSSRGPGSYKTKGDANYPKRPDLSAIGYNTEGAWHDKREADRVDPVAGPLKAISGTSMSTPSVDGAIHLLMMLFGVTTRGPQLDAIVNAIMQTLEKTGQSRDAEGEGFINVLAAYERLVPSRAAIERWNAVSAMRDSAVRTNATLSLEGASPAAFTATSAALARAEGELAALGAQYPLLASDRKKADRMRRELDTYEYKRLTRRYDQLSLQRGALLKAGAEKRGRINDLGDEMLQHVENEVEPELQSIRRRLRAIRAANPRVDYDSASALGRWWLRVTGRGPAA
jgi:Zn-dependent protease